MIERREPSENPAGDGPEDVNAVLDVLRRGEVLKKSGDTVTVYFHMEAPGRIERVSFAGSLAPAVRKRRVMDPFSFALTVSRSMGAGLSEFSLTTPEELQQRERDHRVAVAFRGLWWMERRLERGVFGDE